MSLMMRGLWRSPLLRARARSRDGVRLQAGVETLLVEQVKP